MLFFVIKPVFLSTSTLKTVSKSGLGLSGLISGGSLPDIGGLDELSGGGSGAKELALYEQILSSRRCLEELIVKYNLMDQYDHKYMQDAIKDFSDNLLFISKNIKSSTIVIGVYDYSPEKSKEMTEFLISQLNKINIEMNVQSAKNNRVFIENRYNLVRSDLKNAEDSLKQFQDVYGVAPDLVAKATTQASITLEAEIKSEEVKLELLKKLLSPDQSEIKTQELKITALKKQLDDIKNSDDPREILRLKGTPQTIMAYLRLTRSVEIQNKLLVFLLPIYEQAKIEEVKEMPSVSVLDPPVIPEKKVKPKRLTILLIGVLSTFVVISLSVIVYELYLKSFFVQLSNRSD
jgi:capsule polysaccharide export protein KpsE/RkpR